MTTYPTPGPVEIDLRHSAGEIEVTLAETGQTTVEVTDIGGGPMPWIVDMLGAVSGHDISANAPASERAIVEFSDGGHRGAGRLLVDTRRASGPWRARLRVRITAPEGSTLRLTGQSASVRIGGVAGGLSIRTASGAVHAGDIDGDVRVTTASGDVRLGRVHGAAAIRASAGDVDIEAVHGATSVATVSGTVRLSHVAGDAAVRTVSGDVTADDLAAGHCRIATVSGTVEMSLRRGVVAAVGLASTNGTVRSELAVDRQPPGTPGHGGHQRSSRPNGHHGGPHATNQDRHGNSRRHRADVQLRVRTVSGDIRLRRAAEASEADEGGIDEGGTDDAAPMTPQR